MAVNNGRFLLLEGLMKPKKRNQLRKANRVNHPLVTRSSYIDQMMTYRDLFNDYPVVKLLINNVLQADRLLNRGLLPQSLPLLQLPDDVQDTIFKSINAQFPAHDPNGDQLWEKLSDALPKLDHQLRSFRDYLETEYGMWAYISAPFAKRLAKFINGRKTLEVMAGNGYISKGLQDNHQSVIATDSKDWTTENETGKHPVIEIEQLSAQDAVTKYGDQVEVIIMSWAPDGLPIDWALLQQIRALKRPIDFVTIGEKNGATNSEPFWENAKFIENEAIRELNAHYSRFDLIDDRVYLVQ